MGLSAHKAGVMLEEGKANGKVLTPRQKRYFGFIRGGGKSSKNSEAMSAVHKATS